MIVDEIKAIKSTRKDLRHFGLAVGGVLVFIGALLLWRGRPVWPWLLGPGALLVAAGLVYPPVLKPLQKVWMTFAVIMGWIMTRVILSALFFLVLTPLALVARLVGKDFLDRKMRGEGESYWRKRTPPEDVRTHLERQF